MANPHWYKGMPRVPGSGRKKGTKNKHSVEVRRAQRMATLEMAKRTPEIVEAVADMILDPEVTIWARIKLFETWMRHSMPIPQVTVETDKVSMDSAGDLAVTVIKQAEEQVEDLDAPKSIEATVIAEDDQNAN